MQTLANCQLDIAIVRGTRGYVYDSVQQTLVEYLAFDIQRETFNNAIGSELYLNSVIGASYEEHR